MSGLPLKSPSDASKYRQQYLATIALQANINDANLQANKIYKRTGQTPTQPTDMRLTSERLADIERLKIEVRAQLGNLMDGENAQAVISDLTPEALQFVAQNINAIYKELKPKYGLGILAPIFINYLMKYMLKSSEVNEVAYGLQQNAGSKLLIGAEQIRDLVNEATLMRVAEILQIADTNKEIQYGILQSLRDTLQSYRPLIELVNELTFIGQIKDVDVRALIQGRLNDIFVDVATKKQVEQILQKLVSAITRKDERLADTYARDLRDILAVDENSIQEAIDTLDLINEFKQGGGGEGGGEPINIGGYADLPPAPAPEQGKKATSPKPSLIPQRPLSITAQVGAFEMQYGKLDSINPAELKQRELKKMTTELYTILYPISKQRPSIENYYESVVNRRIETGTKLSKRDYEAVFMIISEALSARINEPSFSMSGVYDRELKPDPYEPVSVKHGKGLKKHITIDHTKGILPISNFIPFGKVFINQDKLKTGIISIRKGKGAYVSGMGIKLVSHTLQDIIGGIIKGTNPSYTQLSKLTDDEREYLYKLGQSSNLLERIGIEAPTKTDDDQDINQFEIYKGQIMSGNDSRKLVADFKKLIVKMISKKLLPLSQAKALLLELVEIGY
jgi:hypothetical protein